MGLLCTCPVASEIADLTADTCPVQLGQIVKVIFQRLYSTGVTKNVFVIASANPNVVASWNTLKAAADGTKVTVSPYLEDPQLEPGDPLTTGGGNASLDGVERIVGRGPTSFEALFNNIAPIIAAELKNYQCETMAVYLVDEHGRIAGLADDLSSVANFYPIPIVPNSLFVGDRRAGRFDEDDSNRLMFSFSPNWSDLLHIVTPTDFNARIDL